jgi:uncharacterized protein YodC (DUF2158 family)
MDNSKIKPGDVVILKSEANLNPSEQHRMTVALSGSGTKFNCYWFSGNDIKKDEFPIDVLQIAD